MATVRGLGVLVVVAVIMLVATAALLEIPRFFRDPNVIDVGGHSIDICDHDLDAACPTDPPNQDQPGDEAPGDNPVFSYPPVPVASAR